MRNCCKALFFLSFLLVLPLSLAIDAPVLSSGTHTEGEWGPANVRFSWEPIDQAIRYCYSYNKDSGAEAPDEPCTEYTSLNLPGKINGGDYYFHVKAVSRSEASPTATFHIKLDIDSPDWESWPPLKAEPLSDGGIKVSWVPSLDTESGIREYEVYRKLMGDFTVRDTPIYLVFSGDTTGFNDNNEMSESTTYHYLVRAIDNVGNPGAVSNEAFAETTAECNLNIDFSAELSSNNSQLHLSISSDDKVYKGNLMAVLPGGEEHTFFEEKEAFTEWSESFDLANVDFGYIDFTLSAQELFGDDCSQEKRFIYDLAKPEASFVFPKYNDKVSETVPFQVGVEDKGTFKSGIDSVKFLIRGGDSWNLIGSGQDSGDGIYTLDWDTFSVENGQQRIKLEVLDKAGNKTDTTLTVTVLNAFESSLDLNQAFEQAVKAKDEALEEMWALAISAISSETLERLIEEADSNISAAKQLSVEEGLENETNAKMMIAEAMLSYNQAKETVKTSAYNEAEFIFNKEQTGILLQAAGISGPTAQQAIQFIEKAKPKRSLKLLKVEDDNATYYRALIEVSFELDVNVLRDSNMGEDVLQVIEVVPKEFAEYAAELDSNISYVVLADDPKLSFTLRREEYKKRNFSYALSQNLTQAQADALLADNIINKFVAPPILLPMEASVGLPLALSSDFLLFAGASIIVIVAAVVVLLLFKKLAGRKKGRFGASPKKFAAKKTEKPKKEDKPKKEKKEKKGRPGFGLSFKFPKFGKKKKSESPLSVFGKS
jgi:hypothetical protein